MAQKPAPQIGPYRLQTQIGSGSMGAVYRAFDPTNQRSVALKCIRIDKNLEMGAQLLFRRGAELASRLHHPHIVRVFEFGEADGYLYLASEFLDGHDLKILLEQKAQTEYFKKLRWMREICSALAFAHQQHVIHRDIKPANIFIRNDGSAVLMDFGIARGLSSDITGYGIIIGTPEYFSPEQVMVSKLDQRSDVFSLGVVFYELITGAHPFRDEEISQTIHRVLNENPAPLPASLPRELNHILLKAMAKAPDDRYADCGKMLQELAEKL